MEILEKSFENVLSQESFLKVMDIFNSDRNIDKSYYNLKRENKIIVFPRLVICQKIEIKRKKEKKGSKGRSFLVGSCGFIVRFKVLEFN